MNNPTLTHDEAVNDLQGKLAFFIEIRDSFEKGQLQTTAHTTCYQTIDSLTQAIAAMQDKKRLDILHEESGIDYRKVADNCSTRIFRAKRMHS